MSVLHDKTNKMTVCRTKTQISLGIGPVWSDWADAQADLSLCWAHSHFVGFVMSRLKFLAYQTWFSAIFTSADKSILHILTHTVG